MAKTSASGKRPSTVNPARRHARSGPKKERLEARISREQKDLFVRAADLQGRSLTDFVVASTQEAALRTVEQMDMIRLTAEESRAFAAAMIGPREPTADLKAAARRYIDRLGR